jgi:hypothetical protein
MKDKVLIFEITGGCICLIFSKYGFVDAFAMNDYLT